jgi:hypothetical protein
MIARIIENWLINTNESFIRTAFCQLLLNEGHNVKNIHGSLEHGKDIISIDSNGDYHAYQLKKGDINTETWRKIKPQIDELVEYPIDYIGFDPEKVHTPCLVISGNINSITNNSIRLYNESKLKNNHPALEIIDKNGLLERFTESQVKFIPKKFDDFYTFLDILTIDGSNFLPKEQFLEFLDNVVFNEIPHHFNDKLNAISSSLIFVSYLLERFQQSENYYALFEAWIILAGCIIRFGKKANLSNEDFENSLELIMANVIDTLRLLKEEILRKKRFFEGNGAFDSARTHGARVVIVLGTLACLELYFHQKNKEYEKDDAFLELIKDKIDYNLFWGESAFPYYFYLIKYLEFNNEHEISNILLEKIFLDILDKNENSSKKTLPSIYYDVNIVIENLIREDIEFYIRNNQFLSYLNDITQINLKKPKLIRTGMKLENGLVTYLSGSQTPSKINYMYENNTLIFSESLKERTNTSTYSKLTLALEKILKYSNLVKIDYNLFSGTSYILETIVLMLTRREKRQILAENWRKISHFLYDKMILDNIEDTFTWYTQNGHNMSVIPKEKQSWKELVDKTNSDEDSSELYHEFIDILQFYILAVPHRVNNDIIRLLDTKLTADMIN